MVSVRCCGFAVAGGLAALYRELVARRWTYLRTGRLQRGLDEVVVVALVVRLAPVNPGWGYVRIVGECGTLGVRVSAASVARSP